MSFVEGSVRSGLYNVTGSMPVTERTTVTYTLPAQTPTVAPLPGRARVTSERLVESGPTYLSAAPVEETADKRPRVSRSYVTQTPIGSGRTVNVNPISTETTVISSDEDDVYTETSYRSEPLISRSNSLISSSDPLVSRTSSLVSVTNPSISRQRSSVSFDDDVVGVSVPLSSGNVAQVRGIRSTRPIGASISIANPDEEELHLTRGMSHARRVDEIINKGTATVNSRRRQDAADSLKSEYDRMFQQIRSETQQLETELEAALSNYEELKRQIGVLVQIKPPVFKYPLEDAGSRLITINFHLPTGHIATHSIDNREPLSTIEQMLRYDLKSLDTMFLSRFPSGVEPLDCAITDSAAACGMSQGQNIYVQYADKTTENGIVVSKTRTRTY